MGPGSIADGRSCQCSKLESSLALRGPTPRELLLAATVLQEGSKGLLWDLFMATGEWGSARKCFVMAALWARPCL